MERQKSDNTHIAAKQAIEEDDHKPATHLQLMHMKSMGVQRLGGGSQQMAGMDSSEGAKRFPNEQLSDSFNFRYMQETRTVPNASEVSMFDRAAANAMLPN